MKDTPVTVPEATADTSYFAVEFPGYLEDLSNPEKALETFGGLEGLQKQRKSHSRNISVKLRPEDEFCHAVVSNDVRKPNMMLLRLNIEEETAHTIPVTQCYAFESPADMQVEETKGTLQCIPPVFQVEDSVEYAVDAYGSGRDAVRSRMYSTMRSGVVLLEYGAPSAPKDVAGYFHDDVDDSDPRLSAAGHVLRKIFKKKPVYMNSALAPVLLEESQGQVFTDEDVNEQLAALCYRFSSGPWRYSWVRKGYDPRHERQSSVYHVITLTDKQQHQSSGEDEDDHDEDDDVLEQDYRSISTLKHPIEKFPVHIHVIDVEHEEVQDRLTKSLNAPSRECTESCGWHVEFSLSKICDTIKDCMSKIHSNIVVQHAEAKESSKHHVYPFSFDSSSMQLLDEEQRPGKRVAHANDATKTSSQLFDILPDEYHDAIGAALAKMSGGKKEKQ
ncbi:hypothetical protein PSENEW3_00002545 [Picochlorum sp. SENEW3]|nr:hypothetical protein PSENEW3_00002545 [Picochlorum sp. SENEW3]